MASGGEPMPPTGGRSGVWADEADATSHSKVPARTVRSMGSAPPMGSNRDVVDQAGGAEPGSHQHADRAFLERADRRQGLGMPGFEIIKHEAGIADRLGAGSQSRRNVLAGADPLRTFLHG